VVLEGALHLVAVRVGVEAQAVDDVDALDNEDAVLDLDLAGGLADEPSPACVDVARLQRAPEGAGQSAGRSGNEVVERRRPLGFAPSRDAVVVGDLVVDAELDLCERQLRAAQRAADALDADVRDVRDVAQLSVTTIFAWAPETWRSQASATRSNG
jgi:hypothetical protein